MVKTYIFWMIPRQIKIEKPIKIIKNIYKQANVNPNHSQFLGRCIVGQLAVAVSNLIKFKYVKINNYIIRFKM